MAAAASLNSHECAATWNLAYCQGALQNDGAICLMPRAYHNGSQYKTTWCTPQRKCPHQQQQCSPGSPGNGATAALIWLDPAARGRRLLRINAFHMACPRALAKMKATLACAICPMGEVCPSARGQLGWPQFLLNDCCLWRHAQLPPCHRPSVPLCYFRHRDSSPGRSGKSRIS